MNQIHFSNHSEMVEMWNKLSNIIKIKKTYSLPPKEYKSSPYQAWIANNWELEKATGKTPPLAGWAMFFRDEQDYITALLIK